MEEMQVVHTLPFAYAAVKYVHILLFVYWLGVWKRGMGG